MRDLPDSWAVERLEKIAIKVGSGATPKGGESAYKAAGTPLIRSMNVVFFGFKRDGLAYIDKEQANALNNVIVAEADVLLNITGASIGRVTLAPSDMNGARVNQHVCIVRPALGIDPRYVSAYLSSPVMQSQIWSDNYGVTRQALTKQQIIDFQIPIPPEAEQTRIADKLDTVLTRVDACRDRLARVAPLLKRFRQSVLAAATSGRLTEDWRVFQHEENTPNLSTGLPPSWNFVLLKSIMASDEPFCYGVVQPGEDDPQGVFLIRAGDLKRGAVSLKNLRRIPAAVDMEYRRSRLRGGEILVTVVGAGIGESAIAPPESAGFNIARALAKIPIRNISARYVQLYLMSSKAIEFMKGEAHEVARPTLNLEQLKKLPVPLPKNPEQTEIVRRVETLFAFADRLEARLKTAQTAADRLTPALLAKAFRGELVPQDPNDEPAAELLKRLAASRDAAPKAKRGRRSATA